MQGVANNETSEDEGVTHGDNGLLFLLGLLNVLLQASTRDIEIHLA